MDRLDKFVENALITDYTQGARRKEHPEYKRINGLVYYYKKTGQPERSEELRKEMQQHPSQDPNDPEYKRLRYVRYADDFLLGLTGLMVEAEEIKIRLSTFLGTHLKLTLAAEKTLITHATTSRARFLGYEIGIMESQTKYDILRRRTVNGKVGLYIPKDVIQKKRKRYMRDDKVIHRAELLNNSEYDIISNYQGEYRGLVEYYGMAQNLAILRYVKWTMETSLLKTFACKGKTTVHKTSKRLLSTTQTPAGPRKSLKLTIPREGKKPLVTTFGGISLRRKKNTTIKDQVLHAYIHQRSELIERLTKGQCEVCGANEHVEMHHIRRLADLNKKGKREKPLWMKIMITRKRKSIPLCQRCHMDIHHNRPRSTRQGNRRAG